MADLYSIISGIQPDQQDVLEAELLAKQILEAKYPDLDLREGTGVRDLVIRPSAFLLALCKKGFDYYFAQNTLSNLDDTSSQELVDDLLSNLFLSRNTGTHAIVSARLYFARQKSVLLNTNISFSTDGALLFFPTITSNYPATALQFDAFQNEWYLDVDLIAAEKGSTYNISSGSLLYFSNFDPYFLHAEINYLSQASTDPETNLEFIARAQSSISTRNLINYPSIISRLTTDFNYLNRIKTIGAGEPEMYRDQIQVPGGPSITRNGQSLSLSDGNTKMTVQLIGHNFSVGQKVDIIESGTSPTKLVLRGATITDVVDSNYFKISPPITVPIRSYLAPAVTSVSDTIYIHQGGLADIHCSDTVSSEIIQYTLDASGNFIVDGPVYSIVRSTVSNGDADTVAFLDPFSVSFEGHTVDGSATYSQDGDGTITVTLKNHPMNVGRMVKISGWPDNASTHYLSVVSVVDQNSFKVGKDLPVYTPSVGINPTLTYVYPRYDVGFSERQRVQVSMGIGNANKTASFVISKFDNLGSIQTYLELSENRVLCTDYLARGFDLYVLDIGLTIYGDSLPSSGYAASIIDEFLKSLAPGQDFILSDLVAKLTSSGGISGLKTPLEVTYKYYTKDIFSYKTDTVVDVLSPESPTAIFIMGNVTTVLEAL